MAQAAVLGGIGVPGTCRAEAIVVVLRLSSLPGGGVREKPGASVERIVVSCSSLSHQIVEGVVIFSVEIIEPWSTQSRAHIWRVGPVEVDITPHLLKWRMTITRTTS